MCLAQTVPAPPIAWNGFTGVDSIIGDVSWTDYQVQSDVLLQQPGAVQVMGRLSNDNAQSTVPGYVFEVADGGAWRLYLHRDDKSNQDLVTGKAAFGVGTWHTLKIAFRGQDIEGWIDGVRVATAHDGTFARGNAGVGVAGWTPAQFDDFSVLP